VFTVQRYVKFEYNSSYFCFRLANSLAAKVQTRSYPRPFEICGGKYDTGKGFSPIAGVL
jgi:hypothetical protein